MRWWNGYKITTLYGSGSAGSTTGNQPISPGIDAPNSYDFSGPVVAYGIYDFTFHFPFGDKYFTLDLRDANWCYQGMADIYIRWNNNTTVRKFEYKNSLTEPDWETLGSSGSSHNIWSLFGKTPNQSAFQTTEPLYFTCANPNQSGDHPHFTWLYPQGPDFTGYPWNFKYNIYRKSDGQSYQKVAENLTGNEISDLAWTDEEITIGHPGGFYDYYAVSQTGSSPESDHSEHEIIRGNPSKPVLENGYLYFSDDDEINDIKKVKLSIFPNPFNPSTNISYYLAIDGYVILSIYNITAQKIEELVNGFKYPGKYSVNFEGQSLAGGIYIIHLKYNQQHITKKILLFK